jgi:hypothetical protein
MTGIREAVVTARCLQTWRVVGPCVRCGEPSSDPAHLAGERLLCAACCCGAGLFSELPVEAFAGIEQQEQRRLF